MIHLQPAFLIAQDALVIERGTSWDMLGQHLLAALVFSLLGVVVFFAALLLMEKLTPFSIAKEIGEEHNTAVAMIVSAMVLGIALIIAAAIKG
jgi:uncharacterized membrane protein YjfL (UPF0719 family)